MDTFTYSAPYSSYDATVGCTYLQRRMTRHADGSFTADQRFVSLGGREDKLYAWKPCSLKMTREQARAKAADWIEAGFTIARTTELGLDNIDAELAAKAARIAARRAQREANRVAA